MERDDVWALFKPYVERFIATYKQFPPEHDHELIAVVNGSRPTNEVTAMFEGLPVRFALYDGEGADIGSFQDVASKLDDGFMVCCVTRVYFHKAGWLRRMMEARTGYGAGLYGTSASEEGGALHVCCRCYGMDVDIFKRYPVAITSRDQGTFFELGEGNLLNFFRKHRFAAKIVHWNCVCDPEDARNFAKTFRLGDQSNMLVWDKHTDIFRDASHSDKRVMHAKMVGF